MKPTQEQIDAALSYIESRHDTTDDGIANLTESLGIDPFDWIYKSVEIMAAAYREKCEEVKQIHKDLGHELRDPNGTIWTEAAKMQDEIIQVKKQRDEWKRLHNLTCVDRVEVMKQRDTLAEALRYLIESCESIDCAALMPSSMPDSYDKAKKALATLKGEA